MLSPSYFSAMLLLVLTIVALQGFSANGASLNKPYARVYYIQAERIEWTYTNNTDINACRNGPYTSEESIYVRPNETTIGSIYIKAVYRQYTDDTFTQRVERTAEWAHLGLLGPVIRGTVGETIKIVFKNALEFSVNLHANAAILQTTNPADAKPNVKPGSIQKYIWQFNEASGPGTGDGTSTMWIYRSYVDPAMSDYTGLIGAVIVTSAGAVNLTTGRPTDVDREFVLMFSVINEESSYYMQENIRRYLPQGEPEDEDDFAESNLKHSINGRMYCYESALLSMNLGERVRWYVMDIGTEVDLHTPHWHGNVIVVKNHNRDEFKMEPGAVSVATMHPDSIGTWLFHCHVNDHIHAGMVTTFTVLGNFAMPTTIPTGQIVKYYIAAEEVIWNYNPGNPSCMSHGVIDSLHGDGPYQSLPQVFKKAQYVCYTDSTFTTKCQQDPHMGLLGPVLRANVGDTIQIELYNKLTFPVSMHPHGVFYNKSSEGAPYFDNAPSKPGASVFPNQTYVYNWFVRNDMGPGPTDGNTLMWMYHSHTDEIKDTNTGLLGMMVISRYGLEKDYDREVFMSLTTYSELQSWYLDEYIANNSLSAALADPEFEEWMDKFAMNGYLHCNQPGLDFVTGDRVRWYVMTLGTEVDIHSLTWTGQTVTQYRSRQSALILQPATMHTVDMVASGCGTFSVYCGIQEHLEYGMASNFVVAAGTGNDTRVCPASPVSYNKIAYIQAEEYEWNYAPRGKGCHGAINEDEGVYLLNGPDRIGNKYIKARYRAYSDATFSTPLSAPAYMGIVGPTIRLAVGDVCKVIFRNMLTVPANIVPLGLQFNSTEIVLPGATTTYIWSATASSGPGINDGATMAWLYHSTANTTLLEQAGLFGAVIVSRAGKNGYATDVDRELVVSVSISNENLSPYLTRNILKYTKTKKAKKVAALIADEDFQESNMKHGFNGNLFCNLHLKVNQGERVRFYLISVGSMLDMHSVTLQDNVMFYGKGSTVYKSFAADAYAGSSRTIDFNAEFLGKFLMECDVHDHHLAGMKAYVYVE